MNRYEMQAFNRGKIQNALQGEGRFEFLNPSDAELILPKAAYNNVRRVAPKGTFEGDSYFLGMVRNHQLRLVREIKEERSMDKLILDQPDIVTREGKVERVIRPDEPLNDSTLPGKVRPEILITEEPVDGVEIILD